MSALTLRVLNGVYGVSRMSPGSPIPLWAEGEGIVSITRSSGELSIICLEARIPSTVSCERGWRCLEVVGPFTFETIGVLASLASPLAAAGIPILCLSTYDTDYLLVREADLQLAEEALRAAGHAVTQAA